MLVCYNRFMDWNFSIGWFFLGLLILIAGSAMVFFYKPISDNMASGINSYQRVKFWGMIVAGIGLLIMANLHTLILSAFVSLVFKR